MSAQYVNPFILVTQELQRVLYKILEHDELSCYKEYQVQPGEPANPAAVELLYHMAAFFGWGLIAFRFGPYTRDAKMIAIMAQIGELLENRSHYSGEAFRFTLGDRVALGAATVRRVGEASSRPAFAVIARHKFEEEMVDEEGEWPRLFRSREVRCTLAAIDRAIAGEPLEGRERLAVLQNLLVDLLAYLEKQEGFQTNFGKRKRVTVENADGHIFHVPNADVHVLHQMPGRVRLGIARLRDDKTFSSTIRVRLESMSHVKSVRVNVDADCVVIEYSRDVAQKEFVRAAMKNIEEELLMPRNAQ